MQWMIMLRDFKYWSAIGALGVALGLTQACARSEPEQPGSEHGTTVTKQLPFHPQEISNSRTGLPNASPGGLPFPAASEARILPAGTLLTVQLEHSLSAANVHAGDTFEAGLAAPLLVNGETLIERGAEVTGRVEALQFRPGSGYMRMTLSAMSVEGTLVGLQTSSLFARCKPKQVNAAADGGLSQRSSGGVRVQKGRRLTFRLSAPVNLGEALAQDRGKTANASPE